MSPRPPRDVAATADLRAPQVPTPTTGGLGLCQLPNSPLLKRIVPALADYPRRVPRAAVSQIKAHGPYADALDALAHQAWERLTSLDLIALARGLACVVGEVKEKARVKANTRARSARDWVAAPGR